jgi:nucleoside-triphosphatase THEP1
VSRPLAILLIGPVFSGKSLFAERLVGALREDGLTITGFLQRGVFDAGGRKIGYDLVGLSSGAVRPIARRSDTGDGWLFADEAFEAALHEVRENADLVVIDELGHLELAGKGHTAAVDHALGSSSVLLVVVREALADRAAERLSPRADITRVRFEAGRDEESIAIIRDSLARADTVH